ncbi:hypothetical protein X777_02172 [Ooceraea biroi]|uniref:Uncharacterized protein n=1 Tax=Ooceraea biroi TaxID=2015173 RepID=A0A026VSJ1_OOCBI|nr:hypothetical protein X777_02172 [Ooceraea biroi]
MGCVRGGGGWTDGRGGGAAGRRVANDERGEIQPRCTYVSLEGATDAVGMRVQSVAKANGLPYVTVRGGKRF